MKKYLALLAALMFVACGSSNNDISDVPVPDIPLNPPATHAKTVKPKGVWIDASANLERFATKDNIDIYLQRIKDTGFNQIYLDVKPGIGYALYNSDVLPTLKTWGSTTINGDWDYLGYWIEKATAIGIDVIPTISTLGYGDANNKQGLVYDDMKWDGKTQMRMDGNNSDKLVDMRDEKNVDAVMLNPCIPEVQQLVLSVVGEIVTRYPKIKGICLDYCRWWSEDFGFSPATMDAFSAYIGQNVSSRNQIITQSGNQGDLYKRWVEFRSQTITNLVTNIRDCVKNINDSVGVYLWASADWGTRYLYGQNWASNTYEPTANNIYTSSYGMTGFAEQLDAFILGAYTEYVWKSENPNSVWTVENFVTTYNSWIKNACKTYGSIQVYNMNVSKISDAIYLCLQHTDGLMVFELSHIINNGIWSQIKDGIDRAEK
ncbi:family 10 glycosylhydrolase [Prevotella sp. KH2C16]|uniref:family 10 glycosylhydrolase n=1 Tax=Prevotella sp. KH2C16 TaxID=1855325 RepID=UPI0008E1243B|nr:family 10 glycosylhydrolase [Prevotella sp. KH2C16]SFG72051.1 Glycosyl hydrolase-like 10 [Prevotella sp. KH2C16]